MTALPIVSASLIVQFWRYKVSGVVKFIETKKLLRGLGTRSYGEIVDKHGRLVWEIEKLPEMDGGGGVTPVCSVA